MIPGRGEPLKWVMLLVNNGDGRGRIRELEMGKLDAGGDIVAKGRWTLRLRAWELVSFLYSASEFNIMSECFSGRDEPDIRAK